MRYSRSLAQLEDWRSPALQGWALIPLRVIVGYGFLVHGYAKFARGPEHFVAVLSALGIPFPQFMAWLTIAVEIFGGLAVLAGAFLPLAAVPLAATLLVAMFTVHLPFGFSSVKLVAVMSGQPKFGPPGYEVDLLYLACLTTLVVGGAGPLAIDNVLPFRWAKHKKSREATFAREHDGAHGKYSDQTRPCLRS
jgi:putative oxidoreductase